MAQRKAKTEVEALLRSEGAPPELLASKLDALDPDTRAALCRNKDNVIAVGARLAEETAKKGGLSVALVRQLARAVPGGEGTDKNTKKLLVEHALVSALAAAMHETLQFALVKEDTTDEEFEAAGAALDSLVGAATALVETKDPEIRAIVAENFLRHLALAVTEPALSALLRRESSQTLLDLVSCVKSAPPSVRSMLEDPDARFAGVYFASLQSAGDMITQVNIAETLYRINKDAFSSLGPDQAAPAINQVLGANAFGPVKREFYNLLCMRRPPKKEALYDALRNMVTRMNTALPGAERKVYTFLPDAVVLLPTRVERPAKGGGWEVLEDVYSKRVDFNQAGFTLHRLTEPEEAAAATHGGSQQPLGSQGPPPAVVEPSEAVDVMYDNIRCIKRDTSTHGFVIWTIGLNKPVNDDDDDDDDQPLTKDALATRATARKAMTTSDAAITLKFAQGDGASLEKDVMPLIFESNPDVVAAKPKPPAVKMSHATLTQGKSGAMDSQHGGGGGGASMLDDPTVAGALQAAPSENFGGQPERSLRVVQPPNASQLRDMFGGDKGAADSQALAPLGTQTGGAGGTQFIGTQVPKLAAAETTAGLTRFMDTLLPEEDFAAEAAEAAREAAAHAARRAKKAPAPAADDSDSDETKDEPGAGATQAPPLRPSAAAPPPAATWGAPVSLGAAAAAAPPPPVSAKKGRGAAKAAPAAAAPAKAAAGGKKKSVTIKKPTQDPTPPVPKPPPPESELTDPPPTGAAAEDPADPFEFVPDSVAAKAPAAKAAKGGDKRAAQTPKKVPKKGPLGLTASLGSGGKHAAPSTRAAAAAPAKPAAKPAPAPAPAPEEEEEDWDAPPRAGFLGGAAMDVDDDIVDDDVAAPLDEEDEEDDDAPPPQQQRKGAAAAKAMPPPPPRAPAAAAAGGRKSVAAPKTAPQEELAAAAAASKRKAAEEEAAAAAAEREAQAQAAAAKKAADAEKAAAAKKAAAAAKKVAAAEKAAAEKAAAAAAKAAAAEAARQKKAAADKAAAEKAKAKPKARKAASASEDSSGDLAEESEEEVEEEAAVKPKPRGKSAAAAQHPPADVTPEDRVAELGVRRVTEALAEQAAAAAAEEAEQEAAAAAKQARRVAKPPRSPPAPAAANPRRTSAELVQRLLAGVDDDAPVAQSSELTACEPVEPRALFRTTSARPQKRKAGSPSGAGAADDATGGGAGRAAKRTRPLPGDTDDATLSALQRIVAEAKAAAAARAKEEISALLAAAWQDLDAALSALAARHADEREAMAAEFAASRAATLRRLNASRDEYQAAVKRFKADVAPMLSGRGGATDTLAALDAAMEERHAETRQKHAAEYKSVTKKMSSKLKQLEENVARLQTSSNTNAHVKSAIEQLLSRM